MKYLAVVSILLPATMAVSFSTPRRPRQPGKPPAFMLAGDSTTAIDGGWGDGFLATLEKPAFGINFGHRGATTKSYRDGGFWKNVTDHVAMYAGDYNVISTMGFGHNDQKNGSGVNHAQFKANMIQFAEEIKALGGTPIIVSPLTRRVFPRDQPNNANDSLSTERLLAKWAAQLTGSTFIDLNQNSLDWIDQIGETEAHKFNYNGTDRTHLNGWGEVVFGRMVADLVQIARPDLDVFINENCTLSDAIWVGNPPPEQA